MHVAVHASSLGDGSSLAVVRGEAGVAGSVGFSPWVMSVLVPFALVNLAVSPLRMVLHPASPVAPSVAISRVTGVAVESIILTG